MFTGAQCPFCSASFSPIDATGNAVKSKSKVRHALAHFRQVCPECGQHFQAGELLPEVNQERNPALFIIWNIWEDDDDEDSNGFTNEDLGLCPHGCRDDAGCDEPGCFGRPRGY